jgi:ABC-type antimicrobial peptide transport system permease subunit
MSETFFSINDLLRRKLQTGLSVSSLALCVGLTLFLLLSADNIGFGVSSFAGERLTFGFSIVFSRFLLFLVILIFIVAAAIAAFTVFSMMSQRVRDIGLMRAAGCPNNMVFGYFFNELLIVDLVGCLAGVALGLLGYYVSVSFSSIFGLNVSQKPLNFWLIPLVFIPFFVLSLVLGAKPVLNATKVEPARAISSVHYLGLSKEAGFRVILKSGLVLKMALRGLFRRKSATIRIVLCSAIVFTLITVAVAGGIIANQTTRNWVEKAVGQQTVLVAHRDVCGQYERLLSRFYAGLDIPLLDYVDVEYLVPATLVAQLRLVPGIVKVDARLVVQAKVNEILGYVIDPETHAAVPVGDSREGQSLVVGVEPQNAVGEWVLNGEFIDGTSQREAVVGESVASKLFSAPLSERVRVLNETFDVVGVCFDPVNNGDVTYVPLERLQNLTGFSGPNMVMLRVGGSADREEVLDEVKAKVDALNLDFEVPELDEILGKTVSFISYIWGTIMFLPVFALGVAALCLTSYVTLIVDEQRQEFGVLRAVGARPRTVLTIVSAQSFVVLVSSYAVGVAFGVIATLLILVQNPLVTGLTVLEIMMWLLIAFAIVFSSSLYPALRFARKPIPEIMNQP